ncbi:MAG: hypothetical protein GF329_21330 [Candidatus Lokiarchaeota archaeon]|nr:hypothetical protein [Candidatus Lokiarchaeota archaeon]
MEKYDKQSEDEVWWKEEFEEGWWKDISWIHPQDTEPSGVSLFIDYMLDKAIITPEAVKIASWIPHRLILLEIQHPLKGTERLSFMISPTSVTPGIPDTTPDVIITYNYYDLAKFLIGREKDFTLSFWAGHSRVYGNLTALLDLADILEVALGKSIEEAKKDRTRNWPVGYP